MPQTDKTCPICGSAAAPAFLSKWVQVLRCDGPGCGHRFASEPWAGPLNDPSWDYDEQYRRFRTRDARLVDFWARRGLITSGCRVLDVGAGGGHILRAVRDRFPDVEIQCLEPDPVCRQELENHGFAVADSLDALAQPFDAVLLVEVVEHVPDPVGLLRRCRELLAPGGRAFVSTPDGEVMCGRRSAEAYDTREHLHFFSAASLREACRRAGLGQLKLEFIEALYPPRRGAALRRLLRPLRRLASRSGPGHLTGFAEP